jgi:histidinol-phosphate aminotransferase
MAGARLGYAVASKEIISDLEKIKYSTNPYNINRLTLIAGEAALRQNAYYMDNCRKVIEAREYASAELKRLGFVMTDSKANFIFAKSEKIGGKELYEKLRARGILVRHFSKEKIKDYNRITVGTKEQMKALVDAVSDILKEN